MLDLEPIKRRLAAATPGPWTPTRRDDIAGGQVYGADGLVICEMTFARPEDVSDANGQLVGHAPADLAALVAEVERLRPLADAARLFTVACAEDEAYLADKASDEGWVETEHAIRALWRLCETTAPTEP